MEIINAYEIFRSHGLDIQSLLRKATEVVVNNTSQEIAGSLDVSSATQLRFLNKLLNSKDFVCGTGKEGIEVNTKDDDQSVRKKVTHRMTEQQVLLLRFQAMNLLKEHL